MSDSVPFDSLSVGTEAGTGAERPTPQSPTIPIPDPIAPQAPPTPIAIPIPVPPPALPYSLFFTCWASRSSPPAPASDKFSTMDSVSVTTR